MTDRAISFQQLIGNGVIFDVAPVTEFIVAINRH